MRNSAQARNLVISCLTIIGILLVSGVFVAPTPGSNTALAAPIQQATDFKFQPLLGTYNQKPGDQFTFTTNLTNEGVADNFTLSAAPPAGITLAPQGILPNDTIRIGANDSESISFVFIIAANAASGTYNIPLTAERESTGSTTSALLTVTVATPTATTTPITPTSTVGPSPTPEPVCQDGRDTTGAGTEPGNAKFLLVNKEETHGICTQGAENWFKFGAVGGKVYSIDITQMDAGLDLVIELYDPNLNRIAGNDDFFARTPTPLIPSTVTLPRNDIRPRIQSWRAPYDGVYYIRIRDSLNVGGQNANYGIIVRAESYGATPVLIPEICRDLYEEDGLPENAHEITVNETHPEKITCPTGDADWVRFFAKAGKIYYIYTDTRRFTARDPSGAEVPEPGADTVLYLFDRDGITLLAFNDDITNPNDPVRNSLDSEIRFTPSVDGTYYAQMKNTGDVGNQFIRYDLTLRLCIPGQECGRSPFVQPAPQPTPPPNVPTNTFTPDQPTSTVPLATLRPTSTLSPADQTATATFAVFSQSGLAPGQMVNGPINGFVDGAFQSVWDRNDRPVAERRAARSWTWGPTSLMARGEAYAQAAGGLRQVQYFDKGRMEVNDPAGDRSSKWFVTSGLLVVELITGRMQVGNGEFVQRNPSDMPLAGDPDDANAPRYYSFGGVTGQLAGDRTGQEVSETISRDGQVGRYSGPGRPETRIARFVPESQHNIPQVFWDYLNASGTIFDGGFRSGKLLDWVFTMGYPISEPYWARAKVGGVERDVLVQVFERRVLTYSPDNPPGWRVEQGNVGRHYYTWRYGEALP